MPAPSDNIIIQRAEKPEPRNQPPRIIGRTKIAVRVRNGRREVLHPTKGWRRG